MVESFKTALLHWLRVPAQPEAPAGAPGSLRVFRAAPNFWRLKLVLWLGRQLSTVLGLILAVTFLRSGPLEHVFGTFPKLRSYESLVWVVEAFGLLAFLLQLPVSYFITRLDFELRWYLVTDRSLRLRRGIWRVEELTMTHANVQELTIHQNPWQRLLGIADLKVRSAGGGAASPDGHSAAETHVAYFHGVDNATEIRDLIQEHLRRQRDTGLGDPESAPDEPAPESTAATVKAAREVLAEVRSIRTLLVSP